MSSIQTPSTVTLLTFRPSYTFLHTAAGVASQPGASTEHRNGALLHSSVTVYRLAGHPLSYPYSFLLVFFSFCFECLTILTMEGGFPFQPENDWRLNSYQETLKTLRKQPLSSRNKNLATQNSAQNYGNNFY